LHGGAGRGQVLGRLSQCRPAYSSWTIDPDQLAIEWDACFDHGIDTPRLLLKIGVECTDEALVQYNYCNKFLNLLN
jgi:hypothetical protein